MEITLRQGFIRFAAAATLVFLAPVAAAQSVKDGGYVGCISANHLDQFISAAVKKDQRAIQYMLEQPVCVPLNSSNPISLLKTGFTTAHIRVYVGNDAVELWTVREAIQR